MDGTNADRRIDVVGAVIVRDGLVLCAQRGGEGPLAGLWEFPGGKVEPGEPPRQALRREIAEELQCEVLVGDQVESTAHEYGFGVVSLTTFYCELATGEPVLTEHAAILWSSPAHLDQLAWAPADLPAVARIRCDAG